MKTSNIIKNNPFASGLISFDMKPRKEEEEKLEEGDVFH